MGSSRGREGTRAGGGGGGVEVRGKGIGRGRERRRNEKGEENRINWEVGKRRRVSGSGGQGKPEEEGITTPHHINHSSHHPNEITHPTPEITTTTVCPTMPKASKRHTLPWHSTTTQVHVVQTNKT